MKAATAPAIVPPTISDADFLKFREFFYRKTGIHFEESKRYFVDKRLIERIEATGSDSFRAYFIALRFEAGGRELQQLVNLMTVNETYFFRESYLLERWRHIDDYEVEILSSDIDTTVLAAAERGVYSARSVANLPKHYLDKYFRRLSDNEYQISRDLVAAVDFSRVNLSDAADTRRFRDIDVIFCRNLLIYFDDLSRRLAAEAMYDALNPGGFVCLGHSESMSRISSLYAVRRFPDAMVYQKPLPGERP